MRNCELLALLAGTTAGVCERIQSTNCALKEMILLGVCPSNACMCFK